MSHSKVVSDDSYSQHQSFPLKTVRSFHPRQSKLYFPPKNITTEENKNYTVASYATLYEIKFSSPEELRRLP